MPELVLDLLKYVFLAVLYIFIARAVRAIYLELRPQTAPSRGSERSYAPPPSRPPSRRQRKAPRKAAIIEGALKGKTLDLDDDGKPKERISITREPVVIGRLSSSDVVLSDPNVSRRHAELRRDSGRWTLVDLGSTNGTLVNGKLAKEHALKDGDRIAFGTSELLFKSAPS